MKKKDPCSNKAHDNKPNYSSLQGIEIMVFDDNGEEQNLPNKILSSIQRLVNRRIEKMSDISALDQCTVFASC